MAASVTGTITFVQEDGHEMEFEITDLNSLYSVTNQIRRSINLDWHVMDFISEMVVVTKDEKDLVLGTEITDRFKEWSESKGHTFLGGRNALYRFLVAENGVRRVSGNNRAGFRGLKIRSNSQTPDVDEEASDLL